MSRLQPAFIAKAKRQIHKPVARLPHSMLKKEADPLIKTTMPGIGSPYTFFERYGADYRLFTLKK